MYSIPDLHKTSILLIIADNYMSMTENNVPFLSVNV